MMKEFSIIHNYRADRQENLFTFLIGKQSSINFMHYYLNEKIDVFVDGYIVDEILQNSGQSKKNHCSQLIDKIIAIINSGKTEELSKINGHYNIIICDKNNNKITVVTDRYGMRPLFWYKNSNSTIISNSVLAICKYDQFDNQINFSAIADFIKFEWVTNDATFFKNIERFQAGKISIFNEGRLESKEYYFWPAVIPRNNISILENAEHGFELLNNSVKRVLSGVSSPGVTLSGGLDSRMITGLICRLSIQPSLYHCLLNKNEKLGAQGVANVYNIDLRIEAALRLTYKICGLPIMYSDGCTSINQFWLTKSYQNIFHDNIADCVIDGYSLDILFNLFGMNDFVRYNLPSKSSDELGIITDENRRIIANKIYGLPKGYIEKYFNGSELGNIDKISLRNIEKQCSFIKNNDIIHFCQMLYWVTRGKRYVYMMSYINQHYCDIRFPGLDYDLIDFCLQLPIYQLIQPIVYFKIFEIYFPELHEVIWSKTGIPPKMGLKTPKKVNEFLKEAKYILRRATLGRVDLESSESDYNRLFRKDKRFRNTIIHFLRDGQCVKNGIILTKGFERLYNDIYYGRNDFSVIERLIAIELFFRYFVLRENNETSI